MTKPTEEHDCVAADPASAAGGTPGLRIAVLRDTATRHTRLRDLLAQPRALAGRSLITDVSSRTLRALEFSGLESWDDVLDKTIAGLMGTKYMSSRSVDEVLAVAGAACGTKPIPANSLSPAGDPSAGGVAPHEGATPAPTFEVALATPASRGALVSIPPVLRLAVALAAIQHDRGAVFMAEQLDAWCPDVADGEIGPPPELVLGSASDYTVNEELWRVATTGIFRECGRLGSDFWPLVLASRVLVEGKPETLAVVGDAAGVTRERVRQVEGVIRDELARNLRGQRLAQIRVLGCELADELGDVCTAAQIDAAITNAVRATSTDADEGACSLRRSLLRVVLGKYVQQGELLVRQRVYDALARLDRAIREAWCGELLAPSMIDAVLIGLGIETTYHDRVRASLGLHSLNGWYVDWRRSQPDKAVAVIEAHGRPLSMNEIHDGVGFHVNPRSLAMRVQDDERIRRLGKDRYGLTAWGGEEYSGILDELEQAIERNGGSIELNDTVESFVALFGVSAGSVRTYAADRRFLTEGGRVRFRTGDDPDVEYRRDPIELAPGTSLLNGVWHLRIDVDHDVLRGSGRIIRKAVAYEAGGEPDLTVGYDYRSAHVTFYWGGTQPNLGSIRPVVEALGCVEGDYIFLPLGGAEPRTARAMRRSHVQGRHGLERLRAELGLDPADDPDDIAAILRALGLPSGADLTAVADRLRDRGESSLVNLLPPEYR